METDEMTTASEPVAGYGTNSFADVMMLLYTMPITREVKKSVGQRLVAEATGKNLSDTAERIAHLSRLKKDWDGRGALPVSRVVLNNLRNVLLLSDDTDWANWSISPDVNATVCLFSARTQASISLGASEYSYFARINGKRYGDSHIAFSPESFLGVMRKFA